MLKDSSLYFKIQFSNTMLKLGLIRIIWAIKSVLIKESRTGADDDNGSKLYLLDPSWSPMMIFTVLCQLY